MIYAEWSCFKEKQILLPGMSSMEMYNFEKRIIEVLNILLLTHQSINQWWVLSCSEAPWAAVEDIERSMMPFIAFEEFLIWF